MEREMDRDVILHYVVVFWGLVLNMAGRIFLCISSGSKRYKFYDRDTDIFAESQEVWIFQRKELKNNGCGTR